jgi:hypothetical protein
LPNRAHSGVLEGCLEEGYQPEEEGSPGRKKAMGNAAKPAKSAKAAAPSQPRPIRKQTDPPEAPQNPRAPKPESKGAQLLALIGREQGASLAELRQATGWQAHSVRGFISTAGETDARFGERFMPPNELGNPAIRPSDAIILHNAQRRFEIRLYIGLLGSKSVDRGM